MVGQSPPAATTLFASSQSAPSGGDMHRTEGFAPHTLSLGPRCRTRRAGVSRFAPCGGRGGSVSQAGCAMAKIIAEPRSHNRESLRSGHWETSRFESLKPSQTHRAARLLSPLLESRGGHNATAGRARGSNLDELSGLPQQRLPWLDGKRLSSFGHSGRHLGERFGLKTGIPLAAS